MTISLDEAALRLQGLAEDLEVASLPELLDRPVSPVNFCTIGGRRAADKIDFFTGEVCTFIGEDIPVNTIRSKGRVRV